MLSVLLALLSGALMSIQGVFNTGVTKQTSLWVAAGFVQLTAFAVCAAAWLITGRADAAALGMVRPVYLLTGGIIGAFITALVIKSIGQLGPSQAAILIVAAQIAVSYIIELFGLFGAEKQPFSWRKLIGTAVAAAGIILIRWEKS